MTELEIMHERQETFTSVYVQLFCLDRAIISSFHVKLQMFVTIATRFVKFTCLSTQCLGKQTEVLYTSIRASVTISGLRREIIRTQRRNV